MKKIFIAVAVLFTVGCSVPRATWKGDRINPKILAVFQKEFVSADDVSWDISGNISKANFVYNNVRTEAYYNDDAELVGTVRSILFAELPLTVMKRVDQRFGSIPVYDVVEYSSDGETIYSMIAERASKKIKITATLAGEVWVEKKK